MNEEDKIHINSFKFYDRDELEELTKEYYLENKQLKEQLETSEKARKDAIEFINGVFEMSLYTKSKSLNEEGIEEILDILDIDKGE